MKEFSHIQELSFADAYRAKPGVRVVVGSGKGGVGKTTTDAGILLALERMDVRTYGYDLDGSPSLALLTAAQSPNGEETDLINSIAISTCDGFSIPIAQYSAIIPKLAPEIRARVQMQMDIIADQNNTKKKRSEAVKLSEGIIKDEFLRLAQRLLPSQLDGQETFLPLLRPALQTTAWNLGTDIQGIATAIQLVEFISNRRHLVFNLTHGSESVHADRRPANADVLLLDTENANSLMKLLQVIAEFRIFLGTLSSDTGNMSSKGVGFMLSHSGEGDIFKGFYQSSLRQNPQNFLSAANTAASMLTGKEAFFVQTVNPATAVTEQTLDDIRKLMAHGVSPDFFAMTRWPKGKAEQSDAAGVERDFLERLNRLLIENNTTTSYHRLEETGIQPCSVRSGSMFEQVQHQNMRIMADALMRPL